MAELLVGSALSYFDESQPVENRNDFARLEDRDASHSDDYGLRTYEFGFELWLPILQQHGDHFTKVRVQLVEGRALAVRAWKPRNIADV
jgi:hypothetical protein